MEKENTEWTSIDDLIEESDKLHCLIVKWRGKDFTVYWMELYKKETPQFIDESPVSGPITNEKLIELYNKINEAAVWAMIEKGQKAAVEREVLKIPITKDKWDRLPYQLSNIIVSEIGATKDLIAERFLDGRKQAAN